MAAVVLCGCVLREGRVEALKTGQKEPVRRKPMVIPYKGERIWGVNCRENDTLQQTNH
jgi:hypothetical protein